MSISNDRLKLVYSRSSLSFEQYEELVSWSEHGFRDLLRKCRNAEWCGGEGGVVAQGMGVLGNSLVAYSLASAGYRVVVEPRVFSGSLVCREAIGASVFDVAAMHPIKRTVLLLEVKMVRREVPSQARLPEFGNVDSVYMRVRPRDLICSCSALVLGVLLLLNPPATQLFLPSFIADIRLSGDRRDHKRILESIKRAARQAAGFEP